jgi:DNA-directed RNA polymerase specialized sigma24 family protein
MSKRKDSIAKVAMERFGMSEREYLSDRILRGWSAHKIARELDVSAVAVRARLMMIADHLPGRWVLKGGVK